MEKWCEQISWNDLEYLREEIFDELGMHNNRFISETVATEKKDLKAKKKSVMTTHRVFHFFPKIKNVSRTSRSSVLLEKSDERIGIEICMFIPYFDSYE
ncbi:hypothetical protein KIN20_034062 [Parelaphostrongylus tenuis]|uniref:Uncharacterized protein n=1 Tax=Parelaphostrongylus tenuis TaxID=148309 RepID=A0AAD5R9I7_PARTN|nr:hypothetical protein KIN20_034062 [Parelaphostrongylus tenuis]